MQGAFQEAGGRTIEVTNREYQLRGVGRQPTTSTSSSSWSSAATRTASRYSCKDVGYLQVGYDLRRGIADLDGDGEVVGGIVIMEQGRNVLAVTRALQAASCEQLAPSLPEGIEIVTDLRSLGADLGDADELLPGASSTS